MKHSENRNKSVAVDYTGSTHVTTGNVLLDLDFSPEEALVIEVKGDILRLIKARIKKSSLTQAALAKAIGTHQPEVSNLMNGRISKFTVDRLLMIAVRLGLTPKVSIPAPRPPAKQVRKRVKVEEAAVVAA